MDAVKIHGALGALSASHLSVVTNATRSAVLDQFKVYRDQALIAIRQSREALAELELELMAEEAPASGVAEVVQLVPPDSLQASTAEFRQTIRDIVGRHMGGSGPEAA